MTHYQLDNLINFTILLQFWEHSDDGYIMEKYNTIIQVPLMNNLDNPVSEKIIDWANTWKKNVQEIKCLPILRYLEKVYPETIRSRGLRELLRIIPDELVKNFDKYVGNPNLINKDPYTYFHPNFIDFANNYKQSYRREINLIILTNE